MTAHREHRVRRVRRDSVSAAVRMAIESLERRLQMDTTYVALASGALAQDWTDISLITANNDWSHVAGVEGYRGDDASGVVGADPQTILIPRMAPLQVSANQTSPNTVT